MLSPFTTPYNRAFSLLELLVAVAIFTLVMTIATGALISMLGVNLKNRTTVVATNNLNVALQSMTRTLERADEGGYAVPVSGSEISFTTVPRDGEVASTIAYRLNSGRIERQVDGGAWARITAQGVEVTSLQFQKNSPAGANRVESIRISISAEVGDTSDPAGLSQIHAQTTVSQSTAIQVGTLATTSSAPTANNIPHCGIPNIPGLALEPLDAEKSSFSTVSSRGGTTNIYYAFASPIPAGTYGVHLAAWDSHCAFQNDGVFTGCAQGVQNERWAQDFERITAEIHYEGGGSEYVSGITDDLPCGENFREMVADGTVVDVTPASPWVWSVWQENYNQCWTDSPTNTEPETSNTDCTVNRTDGRWPWGWGEVSSPMECINYFDETHDFSVGEVDTGGEAIVGVTIHHAGCDGNSARDSSHPFYAAWGSNPCPEPPGLADPLGPGNPPWRSGHSVVPACIGFAPPGSAGSGPGADTTIYQMIRE